MAIKEEVFYEGGPHGGDLVFNSIVGATLIGLPLFVGALVRKIWVKYRITNRRVTVIGGWGGRDRSDVIYSEIARVVTVPRGLGAWGDMVLTLKDGSRLELRSLPKFREIYDYIVEQVDERAKQASGPAGQPHRSPQVSKPGSKSAKANGKSAASETQQKLDRRKIETGEVVVEPEEQVVESTGAGREFFDFAETLNGRLAMIGFVTLVILEVATGKTLLELIRSLG